MASNVHQINISKKLWKMEELAMTKKLVAEVRKRECLYIREKAFKEAVDNAWQEVAREVGIEATWCKEKWKNKRTAYITYVNRPLDVHRKPYYLAEELKFLDSYIMYRQRNVPDTRNINNGDDNVDQFSNKSYGNEDGNSDQPFNESYGNEDDDNVDKSSSESYINEDDANSYQSSNVSYGELDAELPDLQHFLLEDGNNEPDGIPQNQTSADASISEQDRDHSVAESQDVKHSVQSFVKSSNPGGHRMSESGTNGKECRGSPRLFDVVETISDIGIIKEEYIKVEQIEVEDDENHLKDPDSDNTEFNLSGQSHSPVVQEDKQKNSGSFNKGTLATFIKKRKREEERPRELYLLSLLPDIQLMSDRQMRTFKSKVSVIVENILSNDGNTSEIKEEI